MKSKRPTNISRRQFITAVSSIGSASLLPSTFTLSEKTPSDFRAVLFDAFPIFDPRPVFQMVLSMFPEKGMELVKAWKMKQFEYCWLRAAGRQYKNFWEVTQDALMSAATSAGLSLSATENERLMSGYLSLDTWPDVLPALEQLKQRGLQIGFLSNMTTDMLTSCIRHSKSDAFFDHVLSTDRVRTYKPDPKAYELGIDALRMKKEQVLFVAFAGWDAAGAKWFGYPTFWVNRLQSPPEELGVVADGSGTSLTDLTAFVLRK